MLSELINNVYADWDLIKRLIKQKDSHLYEQWKAGGYLVDEDVLSMYPCLNQVLEKLEAEENVSVDKDDDWDELDDGEISYL